MTTAITLRQPSISLIERELERDPRLASPNSRRGYLSDLARFEDWRASRPMSKTLVEEYASQLLGKNKSPNSINRSLTSVRWWARRLADLAIESPMPKEQREEYIFQSERISRLKNVKGERSDRGRHVEDADIEALIRACAEDKSRVAGIRDAALIAVTFSTGARRAELAALMMDDIALKDDGADLVIRHGKGNKARKVFVYNGGWQALLAWIAVRGNAEGYLFCGLTRGEGIIHSNQLTGEAIRLILQKRTEQAGIDPITPHDARRMVAGNLIETSDISTAAKILGHSNTQTTMLYDKRVKETPRKAARGLKVPYAG